MSANPTNAGAVRRGACDRCRGQKLRCVRDPAVSSEKCVRCTSADAHCNFGIAKSAGRPPNKPSNDDKSHHRRTSKASNTVNKRKDVPETTTEPPPSWSMSSMSVPATNQPLELVDPFFSTTAFGEDGLPDSFDLNPINLDPSGLTNPTDAFALSMHSTAFPWTPTPQPTNHYLNSQPAPKPTQSTLTTPLFDAFDAEFGPLNTADADVSPYALQFDDDKVLYGFGGAKKRKLSTPVHLPSPSQNSVRKLSEVSIDLNHLFLESHELQQQSATNDAFPSFPEEFAGKVVETSNSFLKVLRSFQYNLGLSRGSDTPLRNSSRSDSSRTPSLASASGDSFPTSPTDHMSPGMAMMATDTKTYRNLDMTVILQLLACYIRITQLHNVLYAAIHQYVTSLPQEYGRGTSHSIFERRAPIFQGLRIGDTQLDDFDVFQIKFVLQTAAQLLGEIECVLALPSNYRVSNKTSDEENGLLSFNVPMQFLEMTMKNSAAIDGESGDGISEIRTSLNKLRNLLRGTINI